MPAGLCDGLHIVPHTDGKIDIGIDQRAAIVSAEHERCTLRRRFMQARLRSRNWLMRCIAGWEKGVRPATAIPRTADGRVAKIRAGQFRVNGGFKMVFMPWHVA